MPGYEFVQQTLVMLTRIVTCAQRIEEPHDLSGANENSYSPMMAFDDRSNDDILVSYMSEKISAGLFDIVK